MNFTDLKIDKKYEEILSKNYIIEPTEVQEKSIPTVLSGRNVIVKAQTGTGKTLAFLLPILTQINEKLPQIQVLILTPTRELADQITKVGKMLTKDTPIAVDSIFGGHRIEGQIEKIKKNTHIIVGTPGRILDHLRRGTINFKHLKQVVIDEADQMLAYGFIEDIYLIHSKIPENQQIMLFSATMQPDIQKLIRDIMPNSRLIEINPQEVVVDGIKQLSLVTTEERKLETLLYALELYNPFMSIVFTKSKVRAKMLYEKMIEQGITDVELLHGELSQNKRERILKQFRSLKLPLLISTDISARGLDVNGITHVFNYDVPRDPEYYVHRIGRTGRMGNVGYAITLMDESEQKYFTKIEKYIKRQIPKIYDRSDYERTKIDKEEVLNLEIKEKKKYNPNRSKTSYGKAASRKKVGQKPKRTGRK